MPTVKPNIMTAIVPIVTENQWEQAVATHAPRNIHRDGCYNAIRGEGTSDMVCWVK